jgi:DNA-binding MarR family transcriptional regulator
MSKLSESAEERSELEGLLGSDLRDVTSVAIRTTRSFGARHDMSANEFRALYFVMLAESAGQTLTAGDLSRQMGLSGAAISNLVERMTESHHLRRETDPADRRKVILRHADRGMDVTRAFLNNVVDSNSRALQCLTASELEAAHRTFQALTAGMRTFRLENDDLSGPGTTPGASQAP